MNLVGYRTHQELARARARWQRRQKRADFIAHAILFCVAVFLGACFADWLTGEVWVSQAVAWWRA